MKFITVLFTLFFFSTTGLAEIYKGKNAEGNVIYSDIPLPNTVIIPVPTDNTIIMPKPVPKVVSEETDEEALYEAFVIVTPEDNSILRITTGDIQLTLAITPELNELEGHHVVIYIDGEEFFDATQLDLQIPKTKHGKQKTKLAKQSPKTDDKESIKATRLDFQIPNIDRGEHILQAMVKDNENNTLIESNIITVHMKRTSIQHKKPTGIPPGPRKANGKAFTPGPQGVIFKPGPIINPSP